MSDEEISTAVTRGSHVYVYNKKGNQIAMIGLGDKNQIKHQQVPTDGTPLF